MGIIANSFVPKDTAKHITLSEIAQLVIDGKIAKIDVEEGSRAVAYETLDGKGQVYTATLSPDEKVTEFLKNNGVDGEKMRRVQIDYKEPSGAKKALYILGPYVFFFILAGFAIFLFTRQIQGQNNRALSFGQAGAKLPDETKVPVKFTDVAGAREAKEELTEVVDFLRMPQKYLELGAKIPRGVLLLGSPGVGKTLLARAVAGEANVPFFHISGSEFVEMFVGVGASRVRDLFKRAKKNAPCLIFIDEIDAVGRQRGTGLGGGHDEREQTLNQILVEMDGFDNDTNVIVVAATNRPDVLDPALLRPGRFDRQVVIDLPDIRDREEILHVHAKNKPLAKDVKLRTIAERTPGFSGADLANLLNEAALLAARVNKKQIDMDVVKEAVDKVMVGPQRKSHILSTEEKKVTAYHEGGHALVGTVLPEADPVHKVTILSRGRAAGYTMKLPQDERRLQNRQHFYDEIAALCGGYAAEKLMFGDVTTGASNDLKVATGMARRLVSRFGMSDALGPVSWGEDSEMVFLGRDISEHKNYSPEIARRIDEEVKRIMEEGVERATAVITEHKQYLDEIAERLITVETLEQEEFNNIVADIMPAKKKGKASKNSEPSESEHQSNSEVAE